MNRTKRRQDLKQQVKQSTPKIYNYTEQEFQRRVTICAQNMLEQAKLDAVTKALNYATTASIATITSAMIDTKGIGIKRINEVIKKSNFNFSCIESGKVTPEDFLKTCEENGVIVEEKLLTKIPDPKPKPPLKTILIHGYPSQEQQKEIQQLLHPETAHIDTIYFEGYTITLATNKPISTITADFVAYQIYNSEDKIPDMRISKDIPIFTGILKKSVVLDTEDDSFKIEFIGGLWGFDFDISEDTENIQEGTTRYAE